MIARSPVRLSEGFNLFESASRSQLNGKTSRVVNSLLDKLDTLSKDPFDVANTLTVQMLKKGWRYNISTFLLGEVLKRKAGNCLGLCCFYGAMLEQLGVGAEYELVTGPKGYQESEEKDLLDYMLTGHAFPFRSPLFAERHVTGEKLLFVTLEHPRLVLDGQRFETTTLAEQESSQIQGQRIRKISYSALTGLVLYELARVAMQSFPFNAGCAESLLQEAILRDSENGEIAGDLAELCLENFDDEGFSKYCGSYVAQNHNDSRFLLRKYSLSGDGECLSRALAQYPTDMCAWTTANVLRQIDENDRRANLAVASQCVARSEVLNLGNFYATYSAVLSELVPDIAVYLVKKSKDKRTSDFEHKLALVFLGSQKRVRWSGKDNPHDHLFSLMQGVDDFSPLQKTRLLFAGNKLLGPETKEWRDHQRQFGDRLTFQRVLEFLECQWSS